jgi:PAS domain S-box-containing protein
VWSLAAGLMVVAGVVLAALAASVWRRRGTTTGLFLAAMLVAVAWWSLTYALELGTGDVATRELWGDLKYAGICALGPAWLAFVLEYTGRGHLVTRQLLVVLAVEPLVVLASLAIPAAHDLVRFYPAAAADQELPVVGTGPLFWGHFVYTNLLLLTASGIFVTAVTRVSRLYWRLSGTLVAAALLPWAANLLHNFEVGPFARLDLTPFAFTLTGAVLVFGLYRERLIDLAPVARGLIVETMADAVLVLDTYGRVVDANPAAARTFDRPLSHLAGLTVGDLLPRHPAVASRHARSGSIGPLAELTLTVGGRLRYFDARRQPLPDPRGCEAGELVVLRDITDRKQTETQLRQLLAERSRIAQALQVSLLPAALPAVAGARLAGRYQPAGDGREIGGDFYDVFPVGERDWAVVLGDVSGKGAEAAAVTASIRYTLRTLAAGQPSPRRLLAALNEALLRDNLDERYCTLVYAVASPLEGGLRVSMCLAGHHQPLLRRADGTVEPVGREGTALGLVAEPELHDTVLELAPGDLVCMFTDGLVEARRGRQFFGEEGAAAVLGGACAGSVEQAVAALEHTARDFRGGPLGDDLAVLAFEVIGP